MTNDRFHTINGKIRAKGFIHKLYQIKLMPVYFFSFNNNGIFKKEALKISVSQIKSFLKFFRRFYIFRYQLDISSGKSLNQVLVHCQRRGRKIHFDKINKINQRQHIIRVCERINREGITFLFRGYHGCGDYNKQKGARQKAGLFFQEHEP